MTYCVSSIADFTEMLEGEIGRMQYLGDSVAMLIIPVPHAVNSHFQVGSALLSVSSFLPWRDEDSRDVIGYLEYPAQRTVDDAFAQLRSSSVSVAELLALQQCLAGAHVEGKTERLNTMFGEMIVDRAKFAEATGLPFTAPMTRFTLFAHEVEERVAGESPRHALVALPGAPQDPLADLPGNNLDAIFPLLEERAQNGFETCASFNLSGLSDGWQLRRHPRFDELLGALRHGHGYIVQKSGECGLYMPY